MSEPDIIEQIVSKPLVIFTKIPDSQDTWFTTLAKNFRTAMITEETYSKIEEGVNEGDQYSRSYYNFYLEQVALALERLGKDADDFKDNVKVRLAKYLEEKNKEQPDKEEEEKKGYKLLKTIKRKLGTLAESLDAVTRSSPDNERAETDMLSGIEQLLYRAGAEVAPAAVAGAEVAPAAVAGAEVAPADEPDPTKPQVSNFIDIAYKFVSLAGVKSLKPLIVKINKAILSIVSILQKDLSTIQAFLLVFKSKYISGFNNGKCLEDDNDSLKRALQLMVGDGLDPAVSDDIAPGGPPQKPEPDPIQGAPVPFPAQAAEIDMERAEKSSIASNLLAYLQ